MNFIFNWNRIKSTFIKHSQSDELPTNRFLLLLLFLLLAIIHFHRADSILDAFNLRLHFLNLPFDQLLLRKLAYLCWWGLKISHDLLVLGQSSGHGVNVSRSADSLAELVGNSLEDILTSNKRKQHLHRRRSRGSSRLACRTRRACQP